MKHVYLALLACATLCVQTLSADPIGSAEALRIAQQQYSMENTSVLRAGSFPEFKLAYVRDGGRHRGLLLNYVSRVWRMPCFTCIT